MQRLKSKTALITGAGSGIGKAMGITFAGEGADLCLVDIRQKAVSKVADQCRDFGVKVLDLMTDITDEAQVERMARKTIEGLGKIDILVNNAGRAKIGPFIETSIEEWDRMWMVNVRGTVLVTQAVVPSMIGSGNGHIVNISSGLGIHASANVSAYCATKFAITGFSQALSKELWKDGIKVSVVCPGGVRTSFGDDPSRERNEQLLEPSEVAEVVLGVVTAPGKALVTEVIVRPKNIPFAVQEMK